MSLVSWPWRYSAASGPRTTTAARVRRRKPASSRSALYCPSSSTGVAISAMRRLYGASQKLGQANFGVWICYQFRPMATRAHNAHRKRRTNEGAENYAKAIYELQGRGKAPVGTKAVAERL